MNGLIWNQVGDQHRVRCGCGGYAQVRAEPSVGRSRKVQRCFPRDQFDVEQLR